jgi:hypothetical protein
MNIRGQIWEENETHIVLKLHEPYWSAWQKFKWEKGVEGLGISIEAIRIAELKNKKIRLDVRKYGSYEITWSKARENGHEFIPRDNKPILVVPRTAFDKCSDKRPCKLTDIEHVILDGNIIFSCKNCGHGQMTSQTEIVEHLN